MRDVLRVIQNGNKKSEIWQDDMKVYTVQFYNNGIFTHATKSYVFSEAQSLAESFVSSSAPQLLSE
jgi:hypothetical protein